MSGSARPTLEALDALWARHRNGWRRLLSRAAVREIALRSRFDLDLLLPDRIANAVPKGTIPDCARCEDICCAGIENVVSLRLRDIAVLIDLERTDLISRKKPRFDPNLLTRRPSLGELAGSELWRVLPVMRQVGELRICAALTPELRCSLHPDWPLSCERFPYTLSAVRRQVTWGTRCPEQRVSPEYAARGAEMFESAVGTFNERVRDAVLLAHARPELDQLGVGAFLVAEGEDPFEEPAPAGRLPVLRV
jgi:hypothetical protein